MLASRYLSRDDGQVPAHGIGVTPRQDQPGGRARFDGDPANQMSLVPNGIKSGPDGGPMNTWRLPAGGNYILACHYAGGPALLLSLGPAAHMCEHDLTGFACR